MALQKSGGWLSVQDLWTSPVTLLDVVLYTVLLLLKLSVNLGRRVQRVSRGFRDVSLASCLALG